MKTIKILAILLVVLSASCQKAKVDTLVSAKGHLKSKMNPDSSSSYGLFLKDSYGVIEFKATRQYYNQNVADWDCLAYFLEQPWASYGGSTKVYQDVGRVSINSLELPIESSKGYMIRKTESVASTFNGFLGSTVNFNIEGSASSGYVNKSVPLYIPKALNAKFTDNGDTLNYRPTIKRTSSLNLKWNADPANKEGVVVMVENEHSVDTSGIPDMKNKILYSRNILLLEDNGSYTFTADDFDGIPDNVELLFTIIRGNAALVQNNERTVKLYGMEEIFANQYLLMP